MFAKFSYTWELMGASWRVLKQDKELLLFPLISGICCIAVMLSFALPMFMTSSWQPQEGATTAQQIGYYAILFAFYFCNYFVITFFNVAIVAGAVGRMAGGNPTFMGALREAASRIHLIAGWALMSATIGLILRFIEDKSEFIGKIIAGFMGMAWSVVTFLVVPVLVVENKGPIDALKSSTKLLRETWGEQLVGNFSFGLVFFVLMLPGVAAIFGGGFIIISQRNFVLGGPILGLGIVYMIVLSLIQSTLQAIFQAAVYMHTQGMSSTDATTGAQGFPVRLLQQAMVTKA